MVCRYVFDLETDARTVGFGLMLLTYFFHGFTSYPPQFAVWKIRCLDEPQLLATHGAFEDVQHNGNDKTANRASDHAAVCVPADTHMRHAGNSDIDGDVIRNDSAYAELKYRNRRPRADKTPAKIISNSYNCCDEKKGFVKAEYGDKELNQSCGLRMSR